MVKAKAVYGLKTKNAIRQAFLAHKIIRKSHKTYIISRTPKRIWFSQVFCTA